MKRQIILLCTLCNIAIGHDSWEICGNTVLNWQFGIHCKGTRIELLMCPCILSVLEYKFNSIQLVTIQAKDIRPTDPRKSVIISS